MMQTISCMRSDEGFHFDLGPPSTIAWGDSTGGYHYHTFGVEILPSEIRFLYDSTVVQRLPDRLVPRNDPEYDVVTQLGRGAFNFWIGQFDLDNNDDLSDPFGEKDSVDSHGNYTSRTYAQRRDFELHAAAPSWPGFWPYRGQPAAHDLIDYVCVWDVPSGSEITKYPH